MVIAATGANAFFVLALQILALLTLDPPHFGAFSIAYLGFALAGSLSLSLVCEPWLRSQLERPQNDDWTRYSSVLGYFAGAAALCLGVGLAVVPATRDIAILAAAATALSVYRNGARFRDVRERNWRRPLIGDVAGLVTTLTIGPGALALLPGDPLLAIAVTWFAGAAAAAASSQVPALQRPRVTIEWLRHHRRHVVPLLQDSLLLDAGAIGTPYAVVGILGITDFGIYRAVSNTAAPVRLVLNALRPTVASTPLDRQRRVVRVGTVVLLAVLSGLAAGAGLEVIRAWGVPLGSLSALIPYVVPTMLFVGANLLGHYYYLAARGRVGGSRLVVGRVAQTVTAIVLPLAGAALGGLSAAIWGYAIATLAAAVSWLTLVVTAPDESPSAETDRLPPPF